MWQQYFEHQEVDSEFLRWNWVYLTSCSSFWTCRILQNKAMGTYFHSDEKKSMHEWTLLCKYLTKKKSTDRSLLINRVEQLTRKPGGAQGDERNSGLTRTRLTLRGVSVFEPLDIEMQSGPPVAQKMRLHSRTMGKKRYFIHLTHTGQRRFLINAPR